MRTQTDRPTSRPLVLAALVFSLLAKPATEAASWLITNGRLQAARYAHTATLLPNGTVLVAGGNNGAYLSTAEVYDPASGFWTNTGPLNVARDSHTATLLPNGKVLVVGGEGNSGPLNIVLNSAELFDPSGGSWTNAGTPGTRENHTATLLPNGKVLVVGGYFNGALASATLYDPTSGTWTPTSPMASARYQHTATLLANGQVLVVGGVGTNGIVASAELYDPPSGTWTNTGSLLFGTYEHTATLLPNGQVMVTGGETAFGVVGTVEFYDPTGGTWNVVPFSGLHTYRRYHTATLLPNGQVLVVGGANDSGEVGSAELYDPVSRTWTTTASLGIPRHLHTATLLANGGILVAGGGAAPQADTEEYEWAAGSWTATNPMVAPRSYHTATLLLNGQVLVAGGVGTNNGSSIASAELYDPTSGTWTNTGPLTNPRVAHTATLLANGKVLVAGGYSANTLDVLTRAELYDPASGTWTPTSPMATPRYQHTATLLPDGQVLVAGGVGTNGFVARAELYDPASGTWTNTGPLTNARVAHTATLLADGKVLVAGGYSPDTVHVLTSAELYDPTSGTWSSTASMHTNRFYHTATLLPNGQVLVTGGTIYKFCALFDCQYSIEATAELYDPVTGSWTSTGSMSTPRAEHTATLLPNGQVLLAGGLYSLTNSVFGVTTTNAADLYDPATATWTPTAPLNTGRADFTATLLPNGRVLAAGGDDSYGRDFSSAELFDVGLAYGAAWQPQIDTAAGNPPVLTGSGFRGISEGSSGNGGQDSPADYPVLQLRSLGYERTLSPLATSWSSNSIVTAPISGFPLGWTLATVFVNGIPSPSVIFFLASPVTTIVLSNPATLPGGAFQFTFTNVSGASFTALAATNVSLPLSTWTVLGTATETAAGRFQFTDFQATNSPLRFYSIRSP